MNNSPTGRSTIGYVAFDIRGKRLVFMRDSWPLDSSLRKTERTVYQDLWRNGVKNIARPISGEIVKSGDKVHRTITQKYRDTAHGKDTRARIHFRLITDEIYEPLDNCKCSYKLILVLSDALLAHYLAWTKADILHCDISMNNIMVKCTGPKVGQVEGILNDWDLCKYESELKKGSSHPTHPGTWQFSSAMLLQYPIKLRQVSDDLESFVHILHWTILMWYEHSLSGLSSELRHLVSRTYDEFETFVDYDTGGFHIFNYMLLGKLPFANLSSKPLERLTNKLAGICEEHYNASSTKEQIAKLEDIKIQKGKKSPSQPPAAPVEIDISVRGDDPAELKIQKGKKSPSQPPAAPVEIDISVRGDDPAEHSGSQEGAESSGEEGAESSDEEDARPLLDTSTKPKLQEHFWIWQAFREVIKYMEKNSNTQITNDKVDKPQFTQATESSAQQSTRGLKRSAQSSNESSRSSKRPRTTKGALTTSSSMDSTFKRTRMNSLMIALKLRGYCAL
ncbi:hypothetical protein IEO21_10280 [Rhodonia placenta]|uniref:Fungal-type protein kinase domain-containing protein n=1 Tax=Rhodonia placenta TaxID=104341 RepID=A0A8H7NST4_9APHY|nr:hypothetical protein IEO21_10280 [Postia placenta]